MSSKQFWEVDMISFQKISVSFCTSDWYQSTKKWPLAHGLTRKALQYPRHPIGARIIIIIIINTYKNKCGSDNENNSDEDKNSNNNNNNNDHVHILYSMVIILLIMMMVMVL